MMILFFFSPMMILVKGGDRGQKLQRMNIPNPLPENVTIPLTCARSSQSEPRGRFRSEEAGSKATRSRCRRCSGGAPKGPKIEPHRRVACL